MPGFAVVETRTTGLHPGYGERIVEVAVVQVSEQGEVTGSWDTLVDPQREFALHPIHGIDPDEVRDAPTFEAIAGRVVELVADRVLVAHNHLFTARFVDAEFRRCGSEVPVSGLCTMGMGWHYVGATRSLAACRDSFGIQTDGAHSALSDASATAQVLAGFLETDPGAPYWDVARTQADTWRWPRVEARHALERPRKTPAGPDDHYLARLVARLPDPSLSEECSLHLATIDRALVDRHLSVAEGNALATIADELELGFIQSLTLHAMYLRDLAVAAWADAAAEGGGIGEEERADLHTVGHLLGFGTAEVDDALRDAAPAEHGIAVPAQSSQALTLEEGDLVVFSGEMSCSHAEMEALARSVGLTPHGSVTRKVRLVVAAEPNNGSGKAMKARSYGIPVVSERRFRRMLRTGITHHSETA